MCLENSYYLCKSSSFHRLVNPGGNGTIWSMRDLLVLLVHFLTTLARLLGPGGTRAVIAETLVIKHQLVILNRSRRRAPNLTTADRIVMGLCAHSDDRDHPFRSIPTTYSDASRPLLWTRVRGCLILATE